MGRPSPEGSALNSKQGSTAQHSTRCGTECQLENISLFVIFQLSLMVGRKGERSAQSAILADCQGRAAIEARCQAATGVPRAARKRRIHSGWAGQAGAVMRLPSVWALSNVVLAGTNSPPASS